MFVLRSIVNRFTAIRSLIANMRPQFVEKKKRKERKEKEPYRIFSKYYQYVDSYQCSCVRINSISIMKKQHRRTIYGCDF